MINQYVSNQPSQVLKADLAGEFPVYIYWSKEKSILLYSFSILELLDDARVSKPLRVSNEGVSFLLQSGVVPPPKTVYQDIYILGVGDEACVYTTNNTINIDFSHNFPFLSDKRLPVDAMQPDENLILQMLAEATTSRIDNGKSSFSFHSAGKDSNSIALALAEAGWQDKVTLITHKSTGKMDESEISARIAKYLGFKHQVLHDVGKLNASHICEIKKYFTNAPFPCVDNVTLAYPLYITQLPGLKEANIIDGGGNDSYMATPPVSRELIIFPLSKIAHHAKVMRRFVKSDSLFSPLLRTPAEWCAMSGFSFRDTENILSSSFDVYPYWKHESYLRKDLDLFDFKTSILTPIVASEMHIRKARNFADSICSNMILPFTNKVVAEYFSKMPEKYLFERKTLRNKVVLRELLKRRIELDSDALGKMGWSYDASGILRRNWEGMSCEVLRCKLWDQPSLSKVIKRLSSRMEDSTWRGRTAARLLYRLYLISAWYNYNKYINNGEAL
ncbi:hypothetical protein EQ832_08500 [Pseudomonas sp. ALS1131]|nr:hypothetical protein [Pseudomonas sp. ALS1131]TRO40099.1 hypothetical protein EQ832_08500 [Pseudomonas sp. ALS1131]